MTRTQRPVIRQSSASMALQIDRLQAHVVVRILVKAVGPQRAESNNQARKPSEGGRKNHYEINQLDQGYEQEAGPISWWMHPFIRSSTSVSMCKPIRSAPATEYAETQMAARWCCLSVKVGARRTVMRQGQRKLVTCLMAYSRTPGHCAMNHQKVVVNRILSNVSPGDQVVGESEHGGWTYVWLAGTWPTRHHRKVSEISTRERA